MDPNVEEEQWRELHERDKIEPSQHPQQQQQQQIEWTPIYTQSVSIDTIVESMITNYNDGIMIIKDVINELLNSPFIMDYEKSQLYYYRSLCDQLENGINNTNQYEQQQQPNPMIESSINVQPTLIGDQEQYYVNNETVSIDNQQEQMYFQEYFSYDQSNHNMNNGNEVIETSSILGRALAAASINTNINDSLSPMIDLDQYFNTNDQQQF